ncbi:hypothetical protein [Oerskovia enterophila]|uniref:Uncharacterized protein n=1 Tax=Oerskovia enterophila TaxID=43678 RepID=A0ABX2YD14_9CELL|nr:hypothetical protein [Oerskovia enterophila]OCI32861.1 hypothetical protein OERS_04530 [Oerskovia enterophila]
MVLPTWTWRRSRINVGRKDTSQVGTERLALPIPVRWEGGPVHLVRDPLDLSWSAVGLGHTMTGHAQLDADAFSISFDLQADGEAPGDTDTDADTGDVDLTDCDVPAHASAPLTSRTRFIAALRALVETGHLSTWLLRQRLTPIARRALEKANYAVAREVWGEGGPATMLDQEQIEHLTTVMTLGESQDSERVTPTGVTKSAAARNPLDRIIERLLVTSNFTRVDMHRYLSRAIRVEAETLVRQSVGDPHIGRKVRALAATKAYPDLATLIADYNALYPTDHLSVRRATAALMVTTTLDTRSVSFIGRDGYEHDHRDPNAEFEDWLCEALSPELADGGSIDWDVEPWMLEVSA